VIQVIEYADQPLSWITPMPAQKSTVDIAAYRGEPQDHLFLFSGARQLPSN
jgi:hypothetical protein